MKVTIADEFEAALARSGKSSAVGFLSDWLALGRPVPNVVERSRLCVTPPARLNFTENFERTLGYIYAVRVGLYLTPQREFEIDLGLQYVEEISFDAAVTLAVELHRYLIQFGEAAQIDLEDDELRPEIAQIFHDLGVFRLLNLAPRTAHRTSNLGTRYLNLRCTDTADGVRAAQLNSDLVAASGFQFNNPVKAYEGLAEAITNVVEHAYPKEFDPWPETHGSRMWWAAAAFDQTRRRTRLAIYDAGAGIPATVRPRLQDRGGAKRWAFANDRSILRTVVTRVQAAALAPHRGRGILHMRQFVETHPGSTLTFWSGKGRLRYAITADSGHEGPVRRPSITSRTLSASFPGTLIEWNMAHGDD